MPVSASATDAARAIAAALLCGSLAAGLVHAADPFSTESQVSSSPAGSVASTRVQPCEFDRPEARALSLVDVVDRALCANPQTRAAWANARAQAARLGAARSAYLPTVSANAGAARNRSDGLTAGAAPGGSVTYNSTNAALSAGYVLYDFGARSANLESALQTLIAANFGQDAAAQKVFLSAVQSYYQLFASRAAVEAAREAERASQESYKAATARYSAGAATSADKLQAQTAYSQTTLNRIQAEGNARNAEGTLANTIGVDANRALTYEVPTIKAPDEQFDRNLDQLIAQARRQRPDLAAAEAQVRAARSGVDAARAAGMPTLSLTAGVDMSDTSLTSPIHSQSIGVSLSVPIFTGFNNTYQIRVAQAAVDSQLAQRDSVNLQVAFDVWQAYQNLATGTQAVRSSADLLASATESERVALGRYKAGAGSIIDLVTAQAALASARLQNIQALYSWYVFRAALAQAMGQIDSGVLGEPAAKP